MKLLYCKKCGDIFSLRFEMRQCVCGSTGGRYTSNGLNSEVWGSALPLGITNSSFSWARANQPESGLGSELNAFVIPKNCDTVTYVDPRGTKPQS